MDAMTFNKIAGSVLAALLVIFGMRTLVHEVLAPEKPAKPGYVVEASTTEGEGTKGAEKPAEPEVSIAVLLKDASADKGVKVFAKCKSCHTPNKGGKNGTGPNLWNVMTRGMAKEDGFRYSKALAGHGGAWDYKLLDCFLKKPSACIKGTKMSFGGLKKAKDRANIIAYLRTLADTPPPLPAGE